MPFGHAFQHNFVIFCFRALDPVSQARWNIWDRGDVFPATLTDNLNLGTILILRQQKNWVGGVGKIAILADVWYCIYADIVSGWVGL